MTTSLSYNTIDKPRIEAAIREFLIGIGEDPDREGLEGTPDRVARACEEIFGGMQEDPSFHLLRQFNEPGNEDMVIVKDIPFASMCEHHLLPFTGRAHICYLPSEGKLTGLSKLARVVDTFAKRLQTQETMTAQIADVIESILKPRGIAVAYALSVSFFVLRSMKLRDLTGVLTRSAIATSAVLLLVGAAVAFKTVVALSYAPQIL